MRAYSRTSASERTESSQERTDRGGQRRADCRPRISRSIHLIRHGTLHPFRKTEVEYRLPGLRRNVRSIRKKSLTNLLAKEEKRQKQRVAVSDRDRRGDKSYSSLPARVRPMRGGSVSGGREITVISGFRAFARADS